MRVLLIEPTNWRRVVAAIVAVLAVSLPTFGADVSEPFSDPDWLPAGSVLIDQHTEVGRFDFALSSAEKIRRDIVIDRMREVAGQRFVYTWQLPGTAHLAELNAAISAELSTALFACVGRDCGRSNVWANAVFENALLFGPDDKQRYVAGTAKTEDGDVLIAAYIVQRGNLRKYLHLQVIRPDQPIEFDISQGVANALMGSGLAVLETPRPNDAGEFDAAAGPALTAVADHLRSLAQVQIYVVCHLYSSDSSSDALLASQRCADAAARLLSNAAGDGPSYLPFGAGSLLPRQGNVVNRLELVLPERLARDGRAGATFFRN